MRLLEHIKLWFIIRLDFIRYLVNECVFDFRMKRAVKKYGGGENIPSEILASLMGEGEDPMFVLIIHTNRVCERLGIVSTTTRFFGRVRWILGGELPSIEDRVFGMGLMDEIASRTKETNLYAIVLRELINNQDISWHQLPHRFSSPEEYEEFRKLCGM